MALGVDPHAMVEAVAEIATAVTAAMVVDSAGTLAVGRSGDRLMAVDQVGLVAKVVSDPGRVPTVRAVRDGVTIHRIGIDPGTSC